MFLRIKDMKYTIQVEGSEKLVLEKRDGESLRHILQKVCAFLLFQDEYDSPQIERKLTDDKRAYKPDVVAFDAEGNVSLWVDCGQIHVRKVDDLTRRYPNARIVIMKIDRREMESYAREAQKKVKRIERVEFLAFDDGFLAKLEPLLGHINSIRAEFDETTLELNWNGTELASTIHRLALR